MAKTVKDVRQDHSSGECFPVDFCARASGLNTRRQHQESESTAAELQRETRSVQVVQV